MDGFEASYVIQRPLPDVFGVLANLEEDVKWRDEWVDGKKLTEGPIGVGTRFSLVAALLGRRIDTVYETIEHEPDRVAAWKAVSGPFPLTFRRTFEAVDGGTRVTIVYRADVRGLKRLLLKAMAGSARRSLDKDILTLGKLLETKAQA